jgi:hypothetical protein
MEITSLTPFLMAESGDKFKALMVLFCISYTAKLKLG